MSELDEIREINAHLPFHDPIMPGHNSTLLAGTYVTQHIDHWSNHDRRKRALDRVTKLGQYEDDL